MLDRYERAIMEKLMDILSNEDLKSAPAGRVINIDGKFEFRIVAKLFGDEIVLQWDDSRGEACVSVTDWKKRWLTVTEVFASAMRATVEDC